MTTAHTIGIVGGTGHLGSAIAQAMLPTRFMAPEQLWISSRSGNDSMFKEESGVRITTRNQELVYPCQIVIIAVPPHLFSAVDIHAEDRLLVSVMAGVSIEQIAQQKYASRIVRAMSNPAARIGLAYSPWYASAGVTEADRKSTRKLFESCGLTDEVTDEQQIGRFTAMTGPVPGFLAYYADCMVEYAVKHGVAPTIADRAIRQLFLASGVVVSESDTTPAELVREMIAYAGTTAAGLKAMKTSPLAESIGKGLDAAFEKTQYID